MEPIIRLGTGKILPAYISPPWRIHYALEPNISSYLARLGDYYWTPYATQDSELTADFTCPNEHNASSWQQRNLDAGSPSADVLRWILEPVILQKIR